MARRFKLNTVYIILIIGLFALAYFNSQGLLAGYTVLGISKVSAQGLTWTDATEVIIATVALTDTGEQFYGEGQAFGDGSQTNTGFRITADVESSKCVYPILADMDSKLKEYIYDEGYIFETDVSTARYNQLKAEKCPDAVKFEIRALSLTNRPAGADFNTHIWYCIKEKPITLIRIADSGTVQFDVDISVGASTDTGKYIEGEMETEEKVQTRGPLKSAFLKDSFGKTFGMVEEVMIGLGNTRCPSSSNLKFLFYADASRVYPADYRKIDSYLSNLNNWDNNIRSCFGSYGGVITSSSKIQLENCIDNRNKQLSDSFDNLINSKGDVPFDLQGGTAISVKEEGNAVGRFELENKDKFLIPMLRFVFNADWIGVSFPQPEMKFVGSCTHREFGAMAGSTGTFVVRIQNTGTTGGKALYGFAGECFELTEMAGGETWISAGETKEVTLQAVSQDVAEGYCDMFVRAPQQEEMDSVSCHWEWTTSCDITCDSPWVLDKENCKCICGLEEKAGYAINKVRCEYVEVDPNQPVMCGNGICESGEEAEYFLGIKISDGSCPSDCVGEEPVTPEGLWTILIVIGAIAIIAMLAFGIFGKKKGGKR